MSQKMERNWIGFYTIVSKEIQRFIRIWTQTLLPPVISMALYFIVFGNLMGGRIGHINGFRYIDYIVPGLIMMSIITSAYANVVASFFGAKFQRNIEEMLVSPMPNYVILWGFVVGGVVRGVAVGILVTIVSLFFTQLQLQHLGIIMVVGILTALLFSLAGLINAIFAKKFDDINIIPTFVLSPLTYLGGVFYSIEVLSPFWQKISYLNPILYMVNGFRYGMLGVSDIDLHIALGIIMGCTVFLYCISLYLLKKGVGIRT